MEKPNRHRLILVLLAVLLGAVIVGGFAFLVSERRSHDRTVMEFRALEATASIAEYYARNRELPDAALPPAVIGIAVYDGETGRPVLRAGSTPASIPPELAARAPVSRLDRGEKTLRLLRPLGLRRPTRPMQPGGPDGTPGPHHGGPEEMRERMNRMPHGGDGAQPPASSEPAFGAGPAEILLMDYDVSSILAATRTRFLYWGAAGVSVMVLFATVVVLLRRLRRYEETSRKQEQLLQLGEAARTLAHEIRNPLGAIRLQTAMLRRRSETGRADAGGTWAGGTDATERRRLPELDILDEEVARIDSLVSEVREFLQDPVGTPEEIDIVELAESLPTRFPFPVTVTAGCGDHCMVSFDRNRLHSVLANVIRNAASAMATEHTEPPPVEIHIEPTKETVKLSVFDRGPGLPTDVAEDQLFDPFYTRTSGGFGIGLAVSRRFVDAAGGSITLGNRADGAGAVCTISLPRDNRHARARS